MPQPLHARPRATIIPTQACLKCGQQMRFVALEPHEHYRNLDNRTFECDCGATLTVVVARIDPMP